MSSFGSYSKPLGNGVNITGEYDLTTGRQLTGSVTANPFGTASATYAPSITPNLAAYDSQFPKGPALPPGYGSLKPPQPLPLPNDFTPPPASALARKPSPKPATSLTTASAAPNLTRAFGPQKTVTPAQSFATAAKWDFSTPEGLEKFAHSLSSSSVSDDEIAAAYEHIDNASGGNPYKKLGSMMNAGLLSVDEVEQQMQQLEDRRMFGPGYVRPQMADSTIRYYDRKTLRSSRNPVERELGRRTTRGAKASPRNGYSPTQPIIENAWGWAGYVDPMGEAY